MSVSPVPGPSSGVAARDGDANVGPRTTFVLGGARSGKSRFAESLVTRMVADGDRSRASVPANIAAPGASSITYIATSARVPGDVAFAERIALHQVRRPASWGLIEADHDLAGALRQADTGAHGIVLIDCLTLWLTRLLCPMDADAPRPDWEARLADFDKALAESRSRVVLVSNEIGLGVVPMGAVTRLFVDELGRLNQWVAAACDHVVLTVAGLPLVLKDVTAQSRRDTR